MFGRIGTQELILTLCIVLLIFGPTQLPKIGKTFGKTIRGFKDGIEREAPDDSVESNEN